ncbi:MAG TPA: transposase [Coleofasciculaceae cyanobacterium]
MSRTSKLAATQIKQCTQLECKVIAIGGTTNPVHLLTGFPPKLTISELIGKAKGSSSHWVNHEIKPRELFKWQGGYGAFTLSCDRIDSVADYIRNQPQHHHQKSLIPDWEII